MKIANDRRTEGRPHRRLGARQLAPDGFGGFGLRRYLADGSLDSSFHGEAAFFAGHDAFVRDVAVQSDGKILVVGGEFGGSVAFFVARYNSDGSLDSSFSGDGKATFSFGGESSFYNAATAVVIEPARDQLLVPGPVPLIDFTHGVYGGPRLYRPVSCERRFDTGAFS